MTRPSSVACWWWLPLGLACGSRHVTARWWREAITSHSVRRSTCLLDRWNRTTITASLSRPHTAQQYTDLYHPTTQVTTVHHQCVKLTAQQHRLIPPNNTGHNSPPPMCQINCTTTQTYTTQQHRSQWSSSNMPDCRVYGLRIKSHNGELSVYPESAFDSWFMTMCTL